MHRLQSEKIRVQGALLSNLILDSDLVTVAALGPALARGWSVRLVIFFSPRLAHFLFTFFLLFLASWSSCRRWRLINLALRVSSADKRQFFAHHVGSLMQRRGSL